MTQNIVDSFINYISGEKGLAKNTCLAYKSDLKIFFNFLKNSNLDYKDVSHQNITDFLWQLKKGMRHDNTNNNAPPAEQTSHKPPMAARSLYRISETIRQFYKFLIIENIIAANPTEYLTPAKLPQTLPEMLNYDEVSLLLASISGSDLMSVRNRAMLELLYATGMRVSELINIKVSDINLEDCFVRVLGKGSKERLVPFGEKARLFIEHYISARKKIVSPDEELFITRLGKKMSRIAYWQQLKAAVTATGIKKNITP
ncbi:MAG: tyrosine-type recombinase/integrase, partial [Elusimicrobia bacterium]|nr:tyrosine-type recombinase/integrase [Elusimicrobiota bacterium]